MNVNLNTLAAAGLLTAAHLVAHGSGLGVPEVSVVVFVGYIVVSNFVK